jgi:integrase
MELVQPIRDKEQINDIKEYLRSRNERDYLLFNVGIYTGLRISDILKFTHENLVNRDYLEIREEKTNKVRRIKINVKLKAVIEYYYNNNKCNDCNEKVFDFSRVQAYRIINEACRSIGITDRIGTHTLRKTFGYHHYQKYKDVAVLQSTFGHSAPSVTLRYIGVNDDIIDQCIDELDF